MNQEDQDGHRATDRSKLACDEIAPSAGSADISPASEEETPLSGEGVNHENDKTEANFNENIITQQVQCAVELTTNSGALEGLDKGERSQSEANGKSETRDLVSEFRRLQAEIRDRKPEAANAESKIGSAESERARWERRRMLWVIERRVMEKLKESDAPLDEILRELLASFPGAGELLRPYRLRPP